MSCSSVNINGRHNESITDPKGPSLLIANLDPIWDQCHTNDATSLVYPSKYRGIMATELAAVALGLQAFPVNNPDGCSSDNRTLLELLRKPASTFKSDDQDTPNPNSLIALTSSTTASSVKAPSRVIQVVKPPLSDPPLGSLEAIWDGEKDLCY